MQKLMLIALFFFAQAQSALAGGFLTQPSSGALVADDPVTFRWNAVPGAQAYFLNVRRQDNPDLLYFSQQIPASALSVDVSGMPNDDSQLVADFWYLVGGAWEYEVIGFVSSRSFLTSPAPGATVEGSTVTIHWSAVPEAQAYFVNLRHPANQNAPIFSQQVCRPRRARSR